MQIEIEIPRPGPTFLLVVLIGGGIAWHQLTTQAAMPAETTPAATSSSSDAMGDDTATTTAAVPVSVPAQIPIAPQQPVYSYGYANGGVALPWFSPFGAQMPYPQQMQPTVPSMGYASVIPPETGDPTGDAERARLLSEQTVMEEKTRQSILSQREAILRLQMQALEQQSKSGPMTEGAKEQLRQSVRELTSLMQDKDRSEQFLMDSYVQVMETQEELRMLTENTAVSVTLADLLWPVQPLLGISAYFHDPSYPFANAIGTHQGIDIPTEQGTEILAPAAGVIAQVHDNGLGYNSVVLQLPDGRSLLFGHVSAILVQAGQSVRQGDVVALSGGMPGTPGAGGYSTGPHLHFEVHMKGNAVNPMDYLPNLSEVLGS